MSIEHDALLLRVYVSESRRRRGRDLYRAVIDGMLAHGLRGATALRGIEGFGSHRRVSSDRALAASDLPMLIEVVDDEHRIRSFLPVLESLLDDGLVTLERIQRVIYRPERSGGSSSNRTS
jgi:PII-like signaling protein